MALVAALVAFVRGLWSRHEQTGRHRADPSDWVLAVLAVAILAALVLILVKM